MGTQLSSPPPQPLLANEKKINSLSQKWPGVLVWGLALMVAGRLPEQLARTVRGKVTLAVLVPASPSAPVVRTRLV